MVFKVYYQENSKNVPVREHTQSIYVEGDSERDVREKIKDFPYNIEYVETVTGAYYEYEKNNKEDFKVLELG
ncbi:MULTISPECIES: DNA-dependent RNA polymerase subunit epsilon [Bacillaceae]|uniref:DNA-directed RNA polymerase subunit epsilon n=1 Tax=Peribacillus huizhouensis TaxID=1501239 RepID=A0ABR6CJ07_9BACI|nr:MULTISPECIES: RNA polymerase epsilon subunit [Bacillaceae]MBA9025039.1 DNA-dependent RNA polymerase auxiliary subunit epsilon [Peribacillus huizhouensis]